MPISPNTNFKNGLNSTIKIASYANIILYIISGILIFLFPKVQIFIFGSVQIDESSRLSIAMLMALIAITAQLRINKETMADEVRKYFESTVVASVGDSRDAIRILKSKIRRAVNVRNTFIGIHDAEDDVNYQVGICSLYAEWIGNPNSKEWIDISGPAQLFSERYKNIKVNRSRIYGTHIIKILRHSTPIVNFVIFEYGKNDKEVFFGWISGTSRSAIFSSSHPETVKVFERYFRALERHRLWGKQIVVDYNAKSPSNRVGQRGDLVDKIGKWLTISVRDGEIKTFGFFEIDISKHGVSGQRAGTISINGYILTQDLTFFGDIKHGEDEIAHYANKIFIEYGNAKKSRTGFCFYEFIRNLADSRVEANQLEGFFIDENDSTRNDIFGFKVENELDLYDQNNNRQYALRVLDGLLRGRKIDQSQYDEALLKVK